MPAKEPLEIVRGLRSREAELPHQVFAVDKAVDPQHFRDPRLAIIHVPSPHRPSRHCGSLVRTHDVARALPDLAQLEQNQPALRHVSAYAHTLVRETLH